MCTTASRRSAFLPSCWIKERLGLTVPVVTRAAVLVGNVWSMHVNLLLLLLLSAAVSSYKPVVRLSVILHNGPTTSSCHLAALTPVQPAQACLCCLSCSSAFLDVWVCLPPTPPGCQASVLSEIGDGD